MRKNNEPIEQWEYRVERMSDKELLAEVRFYNRQTYYQGKPILRDVAELTPYQILLESLIKSKNSRL